MHINDTYYVVRSGDHYVSDPVSVWDKTCESYRDATLAERLCAKSDAQHYASWAEAEAEAKKLQAELEIIYNAASMHFVTATVERVDETLLISDVVDKWELYLVDGATREDGIDRIASHSYGKNVIPSYVSECKPQIINYFRTEAAKSEVWLGLSDEEMDALDDYQAKLAAAKKAVSDLEIDLWQKASSAQKMLL
jgi:hypothetical protein